jgi:hypothetical protein
MIKSEGTLTPQVMLQLGYSNNYKALGLTDLTYARKG